ncbi:MAG: hypothetical protein IPG67_11540 [Acidobacteria bacterium]|nr:hypothetical protein [Acidobacteriota bacterium]
MKKLLPIFMTCLLLSSLSFGQSNQPSSVLVEGELQSSLNVATAKLGDEVVLKTTKSIKQNGTVIIAKGSKIFGLVTGVQRKSTDNKGSSISIRFDRVERNGSVTPIRSFVSSVFSIDGKMQSAENDHDRAVAAAAKVSGPYEQRRPAIQPTPSGIFSPNDGQGNPTGYVKKSASRTPPNMPQTFQGVEDSARISDRDRKSLSIFQSSDTASEISSTISLSNGNLKLGKWTMITLVIIP